MAVKLSKVMRRAILTSYVSFGRRRLHYTNNRLKTLEGLRERGLVENQEGMWFLTEAGHAQWVALMCRQRAGVSAW